MDDIKLITERKGGNSKKYTKGEGKQLSNAEKVEFLPQWGPSSREGKTCLPIF